ncbi:MAG TPA: hypothetical protein VLD58_07620 [Gemmatimonadales bacterium]|nr:hypothetical protein [Gemmatimonadales bacterium]
MKRWLGLDLVDLIIHVGITAAVAAFAASTIRGPDGDSAVAFVIAASFAALAWRRARARRHAEELPDPDRLAELEARVADLEQGHDRLVELEERLDFTERMLVRQREQDPARLGPGREEA